MSPFGMALVGDDLYVANADAIVRFPYQRGRDADHRGRARKVVDLPGGPLNHHWTKNIIASRDGSKLYATVGSNSNVGENGMDERGGPRRDLGDRPARPAPSGCSPPACATRTAWPGSPRPARCGPSSTSATRSAATSCPTT